MAIKIMGGTLINTRLIYTLDTLSFAGGAPSCLLINGVRIYIGNASKVEEYYNELKEIIESENKANE